MGVFHSRLGPVRVLSVTSRIECTICMVLDVTANDRTAAIPIGTGYVCQARSQSSVSARLEHHAANSVAYVVNAVILSKDVWNLSRLIRRSPI